MELWLSTVNKILCILGISILPSYATFQLVEQLPHGAQHDNRINIADTDHDFLDEIIFMSYVNANRNTIWFYEQTTIDPFQFHAEDSIIIYWNDTTKFQPWAVVDADVDDRFDMICRFGEGNPPVGGVLIYESPDPFSHPTNEVWRDTAGSSGNFFLSAYDIDRDGFTEFISNRGIPPNSFWIYEASGNNRYDTVYTDNVHNSSTCAFGDFDLDGKIEFVVSSIGGGPSGATYWVFEYMGNGDYELVFQSNLLMFNVFDCFAVSDADGDGKMEFVLKGNPPAPDYGYVAYILEATTNNTYEVIDSIHSHNWYGPTRAYSDAGDIDGDGVPEIVLGAGGAAYVIEAVGNDSFKIVDSLASGVGPQNIRIHDFDNNKISEIVISGLYFTQIYADCNQGVVEENNNRRQTSRFAIKSNPSYNAICIITIDSADEILVKLFNSTGKQILIQREIVKDRLIDIDVRDLPGGIYFVQIETLGYKETKKVILLK